MAEEAAMSLHLLAGSYLDQGIPQSSECPHLKGQQKSLDLVLRIFLSINHSVFMKLITLFSAFLLLSACSPKASHLVAISCVENRVAVTHSNFKGSEKKDDRDESVITHHYLLNYETGQVKRWVDEENAPLVSRVNVRFEPDFISWDFYSNPVASAHTIEEDTYRLNRETLEIEGDFLTKDSVPGVGGYFQRITVNGQCEKTEIPWEKLKPKKI